MRYATLLLLALTALAGCGDSESPGASTNTVPSTTAAAATTPAPATTTPSAKSTPRSAADGDKSGFVDVTSLLGKPLPGEPGCRFAKTFVPDKPSPSAYDGALTLTVTCPKSEGYVPVGQVVNRAGSKPTEITCRDTRGGELFCVYVPNSSLGLYFTGTDRKVVRRRLERLIETVAKLPAGIPPLPRSSAR
ncbi:MAG: hypothetical protein KY433_07330 [Actinobacteria bacterium]|nr:hypothetical protein [Actinomycetota bacterium]